MRNRSDRTCNLARLPSRHETCSWAWQTRGASLMDTVLTSLMAKERSRLRALMFHTISMDTVKVENDTARCTSYAQFRRVACASEDVCTNHALSMLAAVECGHTGKHCGTLRHAKKVDCFAPMKRVFPLYRVESRFHSRNTQCMALLVHTSRTYTSALCNEHIEHW